MPNTLVIQLDDADYKTLKRAAACEGTEIETWLLNTVHEALAATPSDAVERELEDANGWPENFFEATYGSLAEDPLVRLPQSDPEIRELLGNRSPFQG